jgi:hypothetical protein
MELAFLLRVPVSQLWTLLPLSLLVAVVVAIVVAVVALAVI